MRFVVIVGALVLAAVVLGTQSPAFEPPTINLVPQPTPETSVPPTAVPTVAPDYHAAHTVDPRRLVANPQSFRGANIDLIGQALTVSQQDDYTSVQLLAQIPGDQSALNQTVDVGIEFRPAMHNVLGRDCWHVYGVVTPQPAEPRPSGALSNGLTVVVYYAEPLTFSQSGQCFGAWSG